MDDGALNTMEIKRADLGKKKWGENYNIITFWPSIWGPSLCLFRNDLRTIYLTFIRSILEQSAVVWHSSLTKKNRRDLERVQKSAVRVIMSDKYQNYMHGLKTLKLETLDKRRERLCLSFAKKCLNNEKVRNFFPKNVSKQKMKRKKKNRKYLRQKG